MSGISAEQIYDATDIFQQGILRLGEMRPRYERAKYICYLVGTLASEQKDPMPKAEFLYHVGHRLEQIDPRRSVYLRILSADQDYGYSRQSLYKRFELPEGFHSAHALVPQDPTAEAYFIYDNALRPDADADGMRGLALALDAGETFGENYSEAAYWWKRAADAIKARGYKELAIQAEQFAWLDSLLGQAQTDLMDTPPRLSIAEPRYTEAMDLLAPLDALFEEQAELELELDKKWARELLAALPSKFGSKKSGGLFGNLYLKPEKALSTLEETDKAVRQSLYSREKESYARLEALERAIKGELARLGLEAPYDNGAGIRYLSYHSMLNGINGLEESVKHMNESGCWDEKKQEYGFSMPRWLLEKDGTVASPELKAWEYYTRRKKSYDSLLALLYSIYFCQTEQMLYHIFDWRSPYNLKELAQRLSDDKRPEIRRLCSILYQWAIRFFEMEVEKGNDTHGNASYALCEIYGRVLGNREKSLEWGQKCLKNNMYHPEMNYWAAIHPEDYCKGSGDQLYYASTAANKGVEDAKWLAKMLEGDQRRRDKIRAEAYRAASEEIRSQMSAYEDLLDRRERDLNLWVTGEAYTNLERTLAGHMSQESLAHSIYIRNQFEEKHEMALREAAEHILSRERD